MGHLTFKIITRAHFYLHLAILDNQPLYLPITVKYIPTK